MLVNVKKTADNKIEIELDRKVFAMYNEVNDTVIISSTPVKKAKIYFNTKSGFDMIDIENASVHKEVTSEGKTV